MVEGFVEGKQLIVGRGTGDFDFVCVQVRGAGAAALGLFATGTSDQDAAHRFGGGPEKMRAILP